MKKFVRKLKFYSQLALSRDPKKSGAGRDSSVGWNRERGGILSQNPAIPIKKYPNENAIFKIHKKALLKTLTTLLILTVTLR